MNINKQLSKKLSKNGTFNENKFEARCRYAFEGLSQIKSASYIEGWVVTRKEYNVFEHAWLEHQGEVVDPVFWQKEIAYFPGVSFSNNEAHSTLSHKKWLPLVHHKKTNVPNSPANSEDPDYWAAWETAIKYAESQKRGKLWGDQKKWWERLVHQLRKRLP